MESQKQDQSNTQTEKEKGVVPADKKDKKAKTSAVLGGVGLIAWLIPIVGLPVTVIGLVFGIKGYNSQNHTLAVVGVTLCIIGTVLGIANAAIGAYMGYSASFL